MEFGIDRTCSVLEGHNQFTQNVGCDTSWGEGA